MTKQTDAYQTIRVWKKTLRILRFLSGLYQESQVALLHRLAEEELRRAEERGTITNFP